MFTRADLLKVWVGIELVVVVPIAWINVLVVVVVLLVCFHCSFLVSL